MSNIYVHSDFNPEQDPDDRELLSVITDLEKLLNKDDDADAKGDEYPRNLTIPFCQGIAEEYGFENVTIPIRDILPILAEKKIEGWEAISKVRDEFFGGGSRGRPLVHDRPSHLPANFVRRISSPKGCQGVKACGARSRSPGA